MYAFEYVVISSTQLRDGTYDASGKYRVVPRLGPPRHAAALQKCDSRVSIGELPACAVKSRSLSQSTGRLGFSSTAIRRACAENARRIVEQYELTNALNRVGAFAYSTWLAVRDR